MAEPQYVIEGGEPTRKWKASAGSGAGIGLPLGTVVSYLVSYGFPNMPTEVQIAVVAVIMWAFTQGSMMLAGYVARPARQDRPVLAPAPAPTPPGIPPA